MESRESTKAQRSRRDRKARRNNGVVVDRLEFSPANASQAAVVSAYASGKNVIMSGYAGTGKTSVALALALGDFFRDKVAKVVIYRSAVPTRDMGFMPGTMSEKQAPYEIPYRAIVAELCGRGDAYDILKKNGVIEFSTTSYLRGLTVYDTAVIVDEIQNMTFHELDSITTRIGTGSRMLLCGDYDQTDLVRDVERHGLKRFLDVLHKMNEFYAHDMCLDDVVRSDFLKSYLRAKNAAVSE